MKYKRSFPKRLKAARLAMGLSQEKLGVLAGMDECSASARMNQYETGKHEPDYRTVQKIAKVLNIPTGYFYIEEDDLAQLILQARAKNPDTDKLEYIELTYSWLV